VIRRPNKSVRFRFLHRPIGNAASMVSTMPASWQNPSFDDNVPLTAVQKATRVAPCSCVQVAMEGPVHALVMSLGFHFPHVPQCRPVVCILCHDPCGQFFQRHMVHDEYATIMVEFMLQTSCLFVVKAGGVSS
jgi:hypothetical protein